MTKYYTVEFEIGEPFGDCVNPDEDWVTDLVNYCKISRQLAEILVYRLKHIAKENQKLFNEFWWVG